MLSSGDVIGEWLVEEILGEGSMGVVFRCREREHRSIQAAVKVARNKLTPRSLKRFYREVELLRYLEHEAIIQFYSRGTDPHSERHWFAMELLDGMTFRERMEYGPLETGHALAMFTRLAEGLSYAHANNVYHRDLKPSNLFLCRSESVRILDFGTGLATEWTPLTEDGQEVGTYAYMPPEIFRGKRYEPTLGDVYGVGLVLYEMLLGQESFLQSLPQMRMMKIQAVPLDPGKKFPTKLRQLIISATHPEPQQRLSSMEALADQLRELSLEHPAPESSSFPTMVTAMGLHTPSKSRSKMSTPCSVEVPPPLGNVAPAIDPSTISDGWWLGNLPGPVSRTQIIDLILNQSLKPTTRIARPGSVWREIRYHPNFREYFNPGSEAYERIQGLRVQTEPVAHRTLGWRRPLMGALVTVLLVGGLGMMWPTPPSPPTPEDLALTSRSDTLQQMLRVHSPSPQGDPALLLSAAQVGLRSQTAQGALEAFELLTQAVLLGGAAEATASLAEAAALLAATDPQRLTAATLALMVATDQGATPAELAPALMAMALTRGDLTTALQESKHCEAPVRCQLMVAQARQDLELLDSIAMANPALPGIGLTRLRILIAQRDWLAVHELSADLQGLLPGEALPYYAAAESTLFLGNTAEFQRVIAQGAAIAPNWLALRHLHARHLLLLGDGDAAVDILRSITADPGFSRYLDRGAVWRDQVVAAQIIRDFDLEEEAADQACQSDAQDPLGWMQKAWVLNRAADSEGARRALGSVDLTRLTGEKRSHYGLLMARLLEATAYDQAAIEELHTITKDVPSSVDAWLALSGVALRQGALTESISALEQAALQDTIQDSSTDPLGALWAPTIDPRPDREALQSAIMAAPELSQRQNSLLGIEAWLLGDVEEAEALLRTARATEPPSAAVLSALGQLLLGQEAFSDAARTLGESVRMEPGRPAIVAMYSYAMAAAGERNTADRLSDLYKSTDHTTVYWKAKALLRLGETEQAKNMLQERSRTAGLSAASWRLLASH